MFEIFFGWRKASKCKKLIKQVQCRLKLLKNKRCAIVRQLRNDVAQLLRHGHEQSAFDRVEQLFKDESIAEVYDLLDHYSEFIIINLPYIRKHKDCPNDISEAISTLVFASSRCGDLPELPLIRELFGERYGQKFVTVALQLLPGNLVNHRVRENLSIQSVSDDLKYKLLDEIARSCFQRSPLRLEYYPEALQEPMNKNMRDESRSLVVHVDSPIALMAAESSSESSTKLHKEMVYLDDVKELKPPLSRDEYGQDQRLFLFKSSVSSGKNSGDGNEKAGKGPGKRRRRRSVSRESKLIDMESLIYYDTSRKCRRKTNAGHGKVVAACCDTRIVQADCSLDRPCYVCISEEPSQKVKGAITTRVQPRPVYPRTVTMPPDRPGKCGGDNDIARSKSFPFKQHCGHVHPKLPDCDELEAKFMALKKESLQCKAKA